jgi:deazaflavin-dependent oxidoreductase (nitroreductase family)
MAGDWNSGVIEEFRANEGQVGGPFSGRLLLLLHHRGAKTGTERVNPLAYQRLDGGNVAIFASKGGHPTHPDWFHNLVANPEVSAEIGTDTIRARARVVEGSERERIWEQQKKDWTGFADYEVKTKGIRTIPVIVLEKV